ncbi:MAG: PulJ/GspJ family protein, partial [Usitatibacter sp.]
MRSHAGFTLIELVVAMALLATMMVLMYSGLTFSLRGWDAGAANG